MEETTQEPGQPIENPQPVSFPSTQKKPKKKGGRWILIVVLLIVVGGGIGLFILGKSKKGEETSLTPTPFVEGAGTMSTSTPTPTPKPIDKSEIKIEVLNGTGIPGEAAFLQGKLANLDYEDIEVGNASDQDHETTTVTFSDEVSDEVKDEIVDELEDIYKDVNAKTSKTLTDFDIRIVTGLKKGTTVSPTEKPETTSTPTPTGGETPTPTETPTTTPTP